MATELSKLKLKETLMTASEVERELGKKVNKDNLSKDLADQVARLEAIEAKATRGASQAVASAQATQLLGEQVAQTKADIDAMREDISANADTAAEAASSANAAAAKAASSAALAETSASAALGAKEELSTAVDDINGFSERISMVERTLAEFESFNAKEIPVFNIPDVSNNSQTVIQDIMRTKNGNYAIFYQRVNTLFCLCVIDGEGVVLDSFTTGYGNGFYGHFIKDPNEDVFFVANDLTHYRRISDGDNHASVEEKVAIDRTLDPSGAVYFYGAGFVDSLLIAGRHIVDMSENRLVQKMDDPVYWPSISPGLCVYKKGVYEYSVNDGLFTIGQRKGNGVEGVQGILNKYQVILSSESTPLAISNNNFEYSPIGFALHTRNTPDLYISSTNVFAYRNTRQELVLCKNTEATETSAHINPPVVTTYTIKPVYEGGVKHSRLFNADGGSVLFSVGNTSVWAGLRPTHVYEITL